MRTRTRQSLILAVLSLVVASTGFAAALGRERALSAPELGLAPSIMMSAQVAASDDGYLATWTDFRSGPPTVYAARFESDGTMLDPTGIRVAEEAYAGTVIWTGRAYLIAYAKGLHVWVQKMSASGTPLGEPIDAGTAWHSSPHAMRMATNGDTVLLVTVSTPAVLLNTDGRVLRTVPLAADESVLIMGFDITSMAATYLVATRYPHVTIQHVSQSGSVGLPIDLFESTGADGVAIASDDSHAVVVWTRQNAYSQLLGPGGTPIGPSRPITAFAPADAEPWGARTPSLVWVRRQYLATFTRWRTNDVNGIRIAADGMPIGAPAPAGGAFAEFNEGDAAARGEQGAAVWVSSRGGVYAGVFDADSIQSAAPFHRVTLLSAAAHAQWDVHLARGGPTTYAAWMEWADGAQQIRLSSGPGQPPVIVGRGYALIDVLVADDVVWVLWNDETSLIARRFTTALTPIDPEPVYLELMQPYDANDIAAAVGNGSLAVVWPVEDEQGDRGVTGAILRATSTGIASERLGIIDEPFVAHSLSVAWNGSQFVAAWASAVLAEGPFPSLPPHDQVVAARVTSDGAILDETPAVIARPDAAVSTVLTARTGDAVAIAWQTADATSAAIFRGIPMPPARELEGEGAALRVLTEDDEGALLLVRGTTTGGLTRWTTIDYLRLRADLSIADSGTPGEIETDTFWTTGGMDAAAGGGTFVIAYERVAREREYGGTSRVFVRQTPAPRRRAVR